MFGKIKKIWKDFDKEVLSKDDNKEKRAFDGQDMKNEKFDFKGQK